MIACDLFQYGGNAGGIQNNFRTYNLLVLKVNKLINKNKIVNLVGGPV